MAYMTVHIAIWFIYIYIYLGLKVVPMSYFWAYIRTILGSSQDFGTTYNWAYNTTCSLPNWTYMDYPRFNSGYKASDKWLLSPMSLQVWYIPGLKVVPRSLLLGLYMYYIGTWTNWGCGSDIRCCFLVWG